MVFSILSLLLVKHTSKFSCFMEYVCFKKGYVDYSEICLTPSFNYLVIVVADIKRLRSWANVMVGADVRWSTHSRTVIVVARTCGLSTAIKCRYP